ncbi:hypothetical protein LS70_007610 [Helicobacter sp. MIT 11-5569]|uniref:hypothetical protein n=1 Tax=Helicobacter sp. MIT 11-5569 TaxID=1548151 RepID=UPI00051FD243|nr:hypothetical protein [Helicobacter sp. MIT 11-5569]TLD81372.1 hypothetical protein LS70_007610 [Helicobacter sp. MIT 11-5569]
MRHKEIEVLNHAVAYQNAMISQIPDIIKGFKKEVQDLDYIFDLNEIIAESKESLFTHYWIHCNAKGNAMIAKKVFATLKNKGMIKSV